MKYKSKKIYVAILITVSAFAICACKTANSTPIPSAALNSTKAPINTSFTLAPPLTNTPAPSETDATATATTADSDNPIDKAFAKDFETAQGTSDHRLLSRSYFIAWEAELNNVAEKFKSTLLFDYDKDDIDKYVAACKALAEASGEIEWMNFSDTTMPTPDRIWGTGAIGAADMREALVYRECTLYLIESYSSSYEIYKFKYSGNGAGLDEMHE